MRTNDDLVDEVESRAFGYLEKRERSPVVLAAMRRVDRHFFLPASPLVEAYEDRAVPIGKGQTCSEPSMVALMMDLLEIEEGHRLLEIGSGSGYAAAVAAILCGSEGSVLGCEMIESLAESMGRNLERWRNSLAERGGQLQDARPPAPIEIIVADGSAGFPDRAPFDRMLISAGVVRRGVVRSGVVRSGDLSREGFFRDEAPVKRGFSEEPLLSQLTDDGILVYPENYGDLHRTRKRSRAVMRDSWTGVSFVPLRGKNA